VSKTGIKIMVTGGGGSPGSQYGLAELQAATAEARRLGKRVAAHCHGTVGIKDAVEAGVTCIEHCTFLEQDGSVFNSDIAGAIVQKGIYVCPTNAVDYRKLQMCGDSAECREQLASREQLITTWRELLRYGAKFVAGSDAGIPQMFCDDYALIMEMVGELSMSPMQAILAGTKVAAEALGMEDEIGTLEVGKRADITALGKVRPMMLGGEAVRSSSDPS
jgi:imidazolonepropionase-like amidohydrolase